ncbi:MAG: MBL fold metallo-hydrolase [Oscillibacter sp.]|nr:MBL fold metallo-hydrolase [Oscillibacter sp.]
MKIKAVKLYDNGFMTQPFAFGGGADPAELDPTVRYRSSLQNFLIDTGDEVILVDTGLPRETPPIPRKEDAALYMGEKITDYLSALRALGYEPEQVTRILVTHKHPDHTGELRSFPNAKIYLSPEEAEALKLTGENIVRAEFADGPYYSFPRSQKVAEGIWYLPAPGHTKGNSIVIAEDGGRFYLFHGDVTYCDAALRANRLSVVFEDLAAARETLDRVRTFIREHPTVYLSTHCPEGYENLENGTIMTLE